MYPGCFAGSGVGDDKLLLSAKLQQQAPVVIAVTNAMSVKYSFPGICFLAHSSIEITKDYLLVVCRGTLETAAELQVELVFFWQFSSKSWGYYLPNPSARAGYDTRSIFKRSLTGLNSEFSFS